jgi:hypothetical protein
LKYLSQAIIGVAFLLIVGFGLRHVFDRVRGAITGDSIYGLVAWHFNWDDAVAEAKRRHRPILVEFSRDSSLGCKQLGKKGWSRGDIAAATADYVTMMVDVDSHPELMKQFGVATVPSLALVDADSQQIVRDGRDTTFTPDELLLWLKPDAQPPLDTSKLRFDQFNLQNNSSGFQTSPYSP